MSIGALLGAASLLCLAAVAWFWPLITPDLGARRYIGPGDLMAQFFQYHAFAARELARGQLAQWNPFMYSGHPFQADIQMAALYPLALANEWLNRFGFSYIAIEWEVVVHVALAALFTFLLVRRLTGSVLAGILGGVVFGFGGFLTSYPLDQIEILESTVWLPLVIYCIDRAVPLPWRKERLGEGRCSTWLALAGAAFALAILGGHPQTLLYMADLAGAYFLFRVPWREWWKGVWLLAAALGLSAAQLLPTGQLIGLADRGRLEYAFAAGGLSPADFAALLTASPTAGAILYTGIVPLALALVAVIAAVKRSPRNPQQATPTGPRGLALFWAGVAFIAAFLSLGTHGPLFRWFFDYLPGWNLFRDQERVIVCFALAMAVLAGYGLAWLQRSWGLHAAVAPLLVAASFANLAWVDRDSRLTSVPPPDISKLRSFLAPVLSDADIFRVRVSEVSIGHDDGNLLGLQFVTGDSVLTLDRYKRWTEDQPDGPRVAEWQLLRLTNSHYVVSSRELCPGGCQPSDGLKLLATDDHPRQIPETDPLPRFADVPSLRLYQVLYPLPRAFFVTQATPVASERQAIDAINAAGFDGGQTILLQTPSVRHSSPPDPSARLVTDVTGYAPGFLDVRTSSDRPAYLFASEVAYPDWQATIDGHATPILTADGAFLAVDVPQGDHHVVFRFVPRLFYTGAAISGLTLLALAIAWGSVLIRKPVRAGTRQMEPASE